MGAGKGWLCPGRSEREGALSISGQELWSCPSLRAAAWWGWGPGALRLPEPAASVVALLLAVSHTGLYCTLDFHQGLKGLSC